MTNKVIRTIKEHSMISKGDTVGVGLSGGADSVALLHILVSNQEQFEIEKIKGIHIHHGIRGEEADRDLEFSKTLCEKLGIDFISYYADVPAEAEKTGESIEECARRIRYNLFAKSGCTKIATAHNLNDNMETVIFNMARGTSLSGLCGIPYVRDIYIRPLLDCTRSEIEDYLKEIELDYVTDSTNLCDDYTRNRIRHNVIPQLFEINPSFDVAFSNCLDSVKLANEYIMQSAVETLEKIRDIEKNCYWCSRIKECNKAVKNQIISLILKEQNVPDITKKYINAVLHIIENGGKASLGGNITANSDREILCFGEMQDVEHFEILVKDDKTQIKTPVGLVNLDYLLKEDLQNLNELEMQDAFDCDKICGNLTIRNRIDGDCYCPMGRVNKKLKKLFNEREVSVYKRSGMLIVSDDNGIVWTEYFGVAERCKIDKNTNNGVMIYVVGE
ncbi:MAG: tRNA lysidine(34) synthetase TilS [Clostridia bacterium]|nr:tRNA lysidine(34) synthetase TilS [Clostridia bacterium]